MINKLSSLTNVGGTIRTRNDIDTLYVHRVDRILHWVEGFSNGVKGSKSRGNIMLPKDLHNLISGPLNKRKMDSWDSFFRFFFNHWISGSFKESFLTKVSAITILNKFYFMLNMKYVKILCLFVKSNINKLTMLTVLFMLIWIF